jgi:hypothetical protein
LIIRNEVENRCSRRGEYKGFHLKKMQEDQFEDLSALINVSLQVERGVDRVNL